MKSTLLVATLSILVLFSTYSLLFAQTNYNSTYTDSTTSSYVEPTSSSSTDYNYNESTTTSASTYDFFGIGGWFWLVVLVLLVLAAVVLYMQ